MKNGGFAIAMLVFGESSISKIHEISSKISLPNDLIPKRLFHHPNPLDGQLPKFS